MEAAIAARKSPPVSTAESEPELAWLPKTGPGFELVLRQSLVPLGGQDHAKMFYIVVDRHILREGEVQERFSTNLDPTDVVPELRPHQIGQHTVLGGRKSIETLAPIEPVS